MTKKKSMMKETKKKQWKRKKQKMTKMLRKNQQKNRKRTDGLVFWSVPYYQLVDDYGYICVCLCMSGNQLFPFLFKNKSI